jgi:peptide deformylase
MPLREFGDPVLRDIAKPLSAIDITKASTRRLIGAMQKQLLSMHAGVALAAPQVGQSLQIVVVAVRPTEHRPDVEEIDLVMINPNIAAVYGRKQQMWEGCLSAGKSGLFAKTPRYHKVQVSYMDEHGAHHQKTFEGLLAQIAQHEIDHLNGVLFVDRVKDTTTYMTKRQYVAMLKSQKNS